MLLKSRKEDWSRKDDIKWTDWGRQNELQSFLYSWLNLNLKGQKHREVCGVLLKKSLLQLLICSGLNWDEQFALWKCSFWKSAEVSWKSTYNWAFEFRSFDLRRKCLLRSKATLASNWLLSQSRRAGWIECRHLLQSWQCLLYGKQS